MREYKLGWREILDLPVAVFFFLSRQIDRLRAEERLAELQLAFVAARGTPEGLSEMQGDLKTLIGTVHVSASKFDRRGLEDLRSLEALA